MRGVSRLLGSLTVAWLIAAPAGAQIQAPQRLAHTPPGGAFALAGSNLTDQGVVVTLERDGTSRTLRPTLIEGGTKATFDVPKELAPGDYFVMVKQADGQPVYAATLVVTAPPQTDTTPKILRTAPTADLGKLWQWGSQYDFDIIGERLTVPTPKPGVTLRLGDQPIELQPCGAPAAGKTLNETTQTSGPCYAVPVGKAGRTVSVHGIPTWEYGGPHNVSLVTPAGRSNDNVTVRISRITPRMIKWLSFVFVVILAGLLVWLGRDAFAGAAGGARRQRFFGWVLLDQQTNTYSLSKVQFLLWLLTIAYAYVLLQLTFVFVQGKTDAMAPFPDNFGWLLGLSGGTSLTSIMLTRARGAKGAGDSGPALSDLVSTGGILAPDRAQLLLWTVIGCCSYLLIVLRTPIESFSALPAVETGMLAAMGLSAVVYAGGKTVRLPGPVINQVAVPSANELMVKGQNLHKNAIISLDRQPAEATIVPTPTPGVASDALSSELKVTITPLPFTKGDHLLRVTNLDGQYAEAWFAADPPKIDQVKVNTGAADEVPPGKAEATLTLTGTGFRAGSTAEWLPAEQTSPTIIKAEKVTIASETSATVALTPGGAEGSATITLVSPHGIRASRVVTVK